MHRMTSTDFGAEKPLFCAQTLSELATTANVFERHPGRTKDRAMPTHATSIRQMTCMALCQSEQTCCNVGWHLLQLCLMANASIPTQLQRIRPCLAESLLTESMPLTLSLQGSELVPCKVAGMSQGNEGKGSCDANACHINQAKRNAKALASLKRHIARAAGIYYKAALWLGNTLKHSRAFRQPLFESFSLISHGRLKVCPGCIA